MKPEIGPQSSHNRAKIYIISPPIFLSPNFNFLTLNYLYASSVKRDEHLEKIQQLLTSSVMCVKNLTQKHDCLT